MELICLFPQFYARLDQASKANILRLVVPDAIVLITSIVTLIMSQRVFKIERYPSPYALQGPQFGTRNLTPSRNIVRLIVDFFQNALLVAAGVIIPSIFNVVSSKFWLLHFKIKSFVSFHFCFIIILSL